MITSEDLHPLVYQLGQISKLFWVEFVAHFEDAQAMLRLGANKLVGFKSFSVEVFHRLYYEPDPELLDPQPPENGWAVRLHAQMVEVVGFDNLIDQCQGNQIAAGFATVELCQKLFEALPPPPQLVKDPQQLRKLVKHLKQHPQLEAARRVREFLHEQLRQKQLCQGSRERYQELSRLQQLQQQVEQMDPDDLIEQLQQMGRAAVRDAQEYAAKLDDSQLRQILRGALADTEQRLVECAEWIAMLGMGWGNEDGNLTQVSIASKLLLAQRFAQNPVLQQIAQLVGRIKLKSDRKRMSKADARFGVVTSLELGNDIPRLAPDEFVKLSDPSLFPLFAQGYYDRSLLQYKLTAKQKQSQGPLIVCLDSSSSMQGVPDTYAKAVTAVLAQIAQQSNRHLRVIHFATNVCRVDDFPPGHHNYQKLLESLLSFFSGGGTAWEPTLKEAIKCLEEQNLFKADVVLVTDGDCSLNLHALKKVNQDKETIGFSILTVLINGERYAYRVKPFSDRVWSLSPAQIQSGEADTVIEELFLI